MLINTSRIKALKILQISHEIDESVSFTFTVRKI